MGQIEMFAPLSKWPFAASMKWRRRAPAFDLSVSF